MTAFGLQQHIQQPTHVGGNTLDLIYSEIVSDSEVINHAVRDLISDHYAVTMTLSTKKPALPKKLATIRKWNKPTQAEWLKELNVDNIEISESLENTVTSLNAEMKRVADKNAPTKNKIIRSKPKTPWFDEEVQCMKNKLRKIEHKCKRDNNRKDEYSKCRRDYINLIRQKKKHHINSKVTECNGNVKALYNLVNSLTKRTKQKSTTRSRLRQRT